MDELLKSVCLLADSHLLFWKNEEGPFMETLIDLTGQEDPSAAYLGASNGDRPEFYQIFEAAMDDVGIERRRMIPSRLSAEDQSFLDQADIILLAGGDVPTGWNVFQSNGVYETILRRRYEGALLIGVSAGAVQLGMFGWSGQGPMAGPMIDMFRFVPFIISAHDEKREWRNLQNAVRLLDGKARGIGIPAGGGMIYHADNSVEPVRQPLREFFLEDEEVKCNLIFPSEDALGREWAGEDDGSSVCA